MSRQPPPSPSTPSTAYFNPYFCDGNRARPLPKDQFEEQAKIWITQSAFQMSFLLIAILEANPASRDVIGNYLKNLKSPQLSSPLNEPSLTIFQQEFQPLLHLSDYYFTCYWFSLYTRRMIRFCVSPRNPTSFIFF